MDSEININLVKYDDAQVQIKKFRDKGCSWEEIKYARRGDINGLQSYLESKYADDMWSTDITAEVWIKITEQQQDAERSRILISKTAVESKNKSGREKLNIRVPDFEYSVWQQYKKKLIRKELSIANIDNIQDSSRDILACLKSDTTKSEPVKGLVVGNVQSGKTANMLGLMALAFDNGWNLIIVLSGTIENLRVQTQKRIKNDLTSNPSRICCEIKENLSKSNVPDLGKNTTCYINVCLKVKSRLNALFDSLKECAKKYKPKILIIDDEADQASINTGDVSMEENRKTINRLICDIVNYKGYTAMNYVCYTATPYANVLNERGKNTLYPQNFIRTLIPSNSYIGPLQIFGDASDADFKSLNIIRRIPNSESKIIQSIHERTSQSLPESLKSALAWFLCCVAALRFYKYKKPLSMLIHTSMKQDDQEDIANAVNSWLCEKHETEIMHLCQSLYEDELNKFTKADFRNAYENYEYVDSDIYDYPLFEDIKPFIEPIIKKLVNIKLDEDKDFNFSDEVHLCVDNCKNNGIDEDGTHLRLLYPDDDQLRQLNFAPAFIVIGGNTLSRGLTLEGLVSTYFLRSVKQVDTLMQMGRWFGYRRKYELFPRIWLTADTQEKFKYLTQIDNDLRQQIINNEYLESSDFSVAVKSHPVANWLRLTAKNKMQMAETSEVDLTGSLIQLVTYKTDKTVLSGNISVVSDFLKSLTAEHRKNNNSGYVWYGVGYDEIMKGIFNNGYQISKSSRSFQNMELVSSWIKNNGVNCWNIILCGKKISQSDANNKWSLNDEISVGKVNRSAYIKRSDEINISVLTSPSDFVSDIMETDFDSEYDYTEMKNDHEINKNYWIYREKSSFKDRGVLLIYIIDRNSKPMDSQSNREALNLEEDVLGLAVLLPGQKGKGKKNCIRVKIKSEDCADIDEDLNYED